MENMVDPLQSDEDDILRSGMGNNYAGKPVTGSALIPPQSCCESRQPSDDKAGLTSELNKTATYESAGKWEDKYRIRMADDDCVYILDRGHIIYDGDKLVARMLGAVRDNTKKGLQEKD